LSNTCSPVTQISSDAIAVGVEGARRRGFVIEKIGKKDGVSSFGWFNRLADKWSQVNKGQELINA